MSKVTMDGVYRKYLRGECLTPQCHTAKLSYKAELESLRIRLADIEGSGLKPEERAHSERMYGLLSMVRELRATTIVAERFSARSANELHNLRIESRKLLHAVETYLDSGVNDTSANLSELVKVAGSIKI